MNLHNIVIVSGSTGDLGRAYLNYYSKRKDTISYAIARREEEKPLRDIKYLISDLENPIITKENIQKIPLDNANEVLFIHPVGKFKFEKYGIPEIDDIQDGIDDEILKSNVDTFHNIVRPLIEEREKCGIIPLKLVAFGSLSDPYHVPWWGSYTKSKLILRREMRELTRREPSVKSVFVNLSSVKTSNENKTRPYADTKYWISPEEVVAKSVQTIEKTQQPYLEIDIFNPSPKYHSGYYQNFDELRKKWLREMKCK